MLDWIDVNSGELPPVEQPILCYCPEWSETGYQVARWSEKQVFTTTKNPTNSLGT